MCITTEGSRVDGSVEIKIKYLNGAPRLEKFSIGDWIDLYTYEDVTLQEGCFTLVSLGVAMKLPAGYEAIIAPRSSTFKHWGILQTNGIGIVDNSYCGNDDVWKMPIYATQAVTIPKGTRLCQFRVQKIQPEIHFVETNDLKSKSRNGFGSSGK